VLRTRRPLLALLLLGVLLAGGYLLSFLDADDPVRGAGPVATSTAPGADRSQPGTGDGARIVRSADLPAEARQVLRLIEDGGPFPYEQDGGVFGNYERLLPEQPRGWYREYTVPTPGERDRGARRIVAGRDGTLYYTADHYDSFARIDQ